MASYVEVKEGDYVGVDQLGPDGVAELNAHRQLVAEGKKATAWEKLAYMTQASLNRITLSQDTNVTAFIAQNALAVNQELVEQDYRGRKPLTLDRIADLKHREDAELERILKSRPEG